MREATRKRIERYAKSFRWTPKNFYWDHTLQVRELALSIQKKAGGDKDIIETAALLHDVGKAKLLAPGHEQISAKLAKEILKKIRFNENKIKKIVECIRYENFQLLETRILRSADSMSLIIDGSGGREWYFEKILRENRDRIIKEIKKSYREIKFDFARKRVRRLYEKLLERYKSANKILKGL